MLSFLLYKTPSKFFDEFDEYYSIINLKQVRIISTIILALSIFLRLAFLVFSDEMTKLDFYHELSSANIFQMIGSTVFFFLSAYLLSHDKTTRKQRKNLVTLFIFYTLTMTFSVTYILSLHNAKNMLTIFLIGIFIVSLFFTTEVKVIFSLVLYVIILNFISFYFSNIDFNQKLINGIAIIILGITLLTFSRYGYYFKSKHFLKIKELEEKNTEVLHLNAQKGEMLSFVAHDLRAPLDNIEALGNLMLMDDEENREAQIIVNATAKAKCIIDDLIEAARQDRQVLLTERIQLDVFIRELLAKWKLISNRDIQLTMQDAALSLRANPVKLERAIDNLISNGIKFSDKPIDITVLKNTKEIIIKVSDQGIGIPLDLQTHIFEQFSVAGRQGLNGEKSVGLGLHISNKIIEQHQGTLLMESAENEGTTFTIALPLESA